MTSVNGVLIRKTASISADGFYRYELTRQWSEREGGLLPFIMLNPSNADAEEDDPTVRRCMGFARSQGASGIIVGNLFAYRSMRLDMLRQVNDPFGPGNQNALESIAARSIECGMPVICAWGRGGVLHGGDKSAINIMQGVGPATLRCLGKSKAGHPRHPLFVRGDQALEVFP